MNTTTTSTRFTHTRSLIATAVLSALISSFSAVCSAADGADAPKAIVNYADLNVSTSQGAATLYNRIRSASEAVCSPFDQRVLAARFRWENCVKQAIAGAVAKVNQPALYAVYVANHGVVPEVKTLTADRR